MARKRNILFPNKGHGFGTTKFKLWNCSFYILRMIAFADTYPDELDKLPGIKKFISTIETACEELQEWEARLAEERSALRLVEHVAELYERFNKEKISKPDQMVILREEFGELITPWLPMPPNLDALLVRHPMYDEEIRGPIELATLKVSSMLGICKSSVYEFKKRPINQKRERGYDFLEQIPLKEFMDLVLRKTFGDFYPDTVRLTWRKFNPAKTKKG